MRPRELFHSVFWHSVSDRSHFCVAMMCWEKERTLLLSKSSTETAWVLNRTEQRKSRLTSDAVYTKSAPGAVKTSAAPTKPEYTQPTLWTMRQSIVCQAPIHSRRQHSYPFEGLRLCRIKFCRDCGESVHRIGAKDIEFGV